MDIFTIRRKCNDDTIEVTQHCLLRIHQRKISYKEIKNIIMHGEIIEEYPNDFPYPSCLIFGKTINNRIIHVVVGINNIKLYLITAYEPDPDKWEDNFKKRKDC
ncbi:DUF4258 domain-containing protein [Megamonas hypermegale]|uniref:DUF4258 domain-containing protein n=1 Tax=Megamonas hypermegale TaxID=158847 RepID=UPI0026EFF2C9|nr:DUF4258 domain-containing protein [Megamonas hypermegale]